MPITVGQIINGVINALAPQSADDSDSTLCSVQNKIQKFDAQGRSYCVAPVIPAPTSPKVAPAPSVSSPPIVIYRDVYRDRYIRVDAPPPPAAPVRTVYVPIPYAAPPQIPVRRLPRQGAPDTATTSTEPSKTIKVRYTLDSLEYGSLLHEPLSYNELKIQYCNDSRYETEFAKRQERAITNYVSAIAQVDTTDPQAPPSVPKTIENLSVAFVSRYFKSFHPSTTKITPIFGASGIAEFINNYINKNYSNFTPLSTVPYSYTLENYCAGAVYPTASNLVSDVFNNLIINDKLGNIESIVTQLYNRVTTLSSKLLFVVEVLAQLSRDVSGLDEDLTTLAAFLKSIGLESLTNRIVTLAQIITNLSTGGANSALLEQLYDNVTNLNAFLRTIGLESINNRIVTLSQIVSGLSVGGADSALLEQLYDNVSNLNTFLRTIGLESINNRIVALSQIVSGLSSASEDLTLLEQLYDNVISLTNDLSALDDFLHAIGLESLNNRIVSLAQVVVSTDNSNDSALLEQIYDNVTSLTNNLSGLDDFLRGIGLESVSNRLISLSQIVFETSNSNSDNSALLEQIYDNITLITRTLSDVSISIDAIGDIVDGTKDDLEELGNFLRSIGLEAVNNRLVTLSQIVSSLSSGSTDVTLLEQLYENLLSLNSFLRNIGLESISNRLVTLSQIVSGLSTGSTDSALLEQLYDNVTNLNTFLRTIGLENLHNRLVSLFQILSSRGSSSSELNSEELEEILRRLGSDDFPITVPTSIIETTDNLGNPVPIGIETIQSIPQFLVWLFHRLDEVLGQWSIPIEIKDTDPTTPGDQSRTMKFPNLAEAVAELLQIALQLSINSELHSSLATRILMEAGQDKQQNFITYNLLQALTDYVGFSYKDKILEMPLLFDPTATSFDTMLTEVKIKVGVPEFDEKLNLQADLMRFRKAGSILDSVYFRKVDPSGDIKAQLLERVFGLRDLLKDINVNSESERFRDFLEEVEAGFTGTPGVGDATRPYGEPYEDRPRFRDLTDQQNPTV